MRMRDENRGAVATVEAVRWLNDVREVRHPIDLNRPLIVRQVSVAEGLPLPRPSVPFPEKHPYCEMAVSFEGRGVQFVGTEKIARKSPDIMLLGPGTPHYAICHSYPQYGIAVHFLPILLFEMGPERDGARFLSRFTALQKIEQRILKPPPELMKSIMARLRLMAQEYAEQKVGAELRLRALLMEILVELFRWEESTGAKLDQRSMALNWSQVEKTLRYIHANYAEPLYVEQIARAVGLSVSRLQVTFRNALGMSCVHYLRALRISHAKALLCNPEARVTEIALQTGFETLSHFNTSFRNLIGKSPTEYMRVHQKKSSCGRQACGRQ